MDFTEKVNKEFDKFLEKVEKRKKDYQFIECTSNGCHYSAGKFSGQVTTAISCTWNSKGIISLNEWSEGKASPNTGEFAAIIKNTEKRQKLEAVPID